MATRFYLQSTGTPAQTPSFDSKWEQTGQASRRPMVRSTRLSAATALTDSSAITVPITTTQQILAYQFIGDEVFAPARLDASVLFSMVIRAIESANTANVFLAYVLKAVTPDGGTSLGTLSTSPDNTGTEVAITTAATRIFSQTAITATTISQPWRLVLEVGGDARSPTAATTYTYRVGSNGASDFALTSALTTDLNPWMELSVNLGQLSVANSSYVRVGDGMSTSERLR